MIGRHSDSEIDVTAPITPPAGIHSETFDTRETAQVAGVDVGKLQNWLTRGVILLAKEQNPGRGQSRKYTAYEVARIRLMRKIADSGVPLSTAFKLTDALKKAWEQVPGGHENYGRELHLTSWLLVLTETEWPTDRKQNLVRADNYVGVWLVDQKGKPEVDRALLPTLAALDDAPVIAINMGRMLHKTMLGLQRVVEKRGRTD
jgi:DNA-binding transcriptional MerR regulator